MKKLDASAVKTELEKGLKAFKAFENALDVINELQGFEQNVKEVMARLDALKKEESTLDAKVSSANEKAAFIVEAANAEAAAVLKRANDLAKSEKDKGDKHYAERVEQAEARLEAVKLEKSALEDDVKAITAKFTTLKEEVKQLELVKQKFLAAIA